MDVKTELVGANDPGYEGWGGWEQPVEEGTPSSGSEAPKDEPVVKQPELPPIEEMDRRTLLRPSTLQALFAAYGADPDAWSDIEADLIDRANALRCRMDLRANLCKVKKLPASTAGSGIVPIPGGSAIPQILGLSALSGVPVQYKTGNCCILNDYGINIYDPDTMRSRQLTGEPIIPVAISEDIDDGTRKIKLKYRKFGDPPTAPLSEATYSLEQISSIQNIIALSKYGFPADSDNAKDLIRYLKDITRLNYDIIPVAKSAKRLGWFPEMPGIPFFPFDSNDKFFFDPGSSRVDAAAAVKCAGDEDAWKAMMLKLRATHNSALLIVTAAALASVLLPICNGLSYIVDIAGDSGKGKSLMQCIAASQIGSYQSYQITLDTSDVGLERALHSLHNLPLIVDDTNNNKSAKARKASDLSSFFNQLVMRICAGTGRARSDLALGSKVDSRWQCCAITSSEQALIDLVAGGGSKNRILTAEYLGETIFPIGKPGEPKPERHPDRIIETIKSNYGFALKRFVEIIRAVEFDAIRDMFYNYQTLITEAAMSVPEDKRPGCMAMILVADELMEKHYYRDGVRISKASAVACLGNSKDVNVNQRMYDHLCTRAVSLRSEHFCYEVEGDANLREDYLPKRDIWGFITLSDKSTILRISEDGLKSLFDDVNGFSVGRGFYQWLITNGKMATRTTENKRIRGTQLQLRVLKIDITLPGHTPNFATQPGVTPIIPPPVTDIMKRMRV